MSTFVPSDPGDKMAEALRRRDEIRAEHNTAKTELDENGDVVAAPRADYAGLHPEEVIPTRTRADMPPLVDLEHDRALRTTFAVKDSGVRQQFDSGMVRDTQEGKIDYTLILDGPMFDRWADHLTKGAVKYAARNWMKAEGDAELERFKQSALRHFLQWFREELDEDHAAAVFFNINGAEYVKAQKGAS